MEENMERIWCLLIGYAFGNLLTAELVAYAKTGRSARSIGSSNPGTANIGAQLGVKWGILVLLGDVLKTIAACLICRLWLFPDLGQLTVVYAGVGTVLGHNFPIWNKFHGGKGVAVTCIFIILYSPLWGTLSCAAGLCFILINRNLALGAIVIPLTFLLPAFLIWGGETFILSLISALLMLLRNLPSLRKNQKNV